MSLRAFAQSSASTESSSSELGVLVTQVDMYNGCKVVVVVLFKYNLALKMS